LLNRFLRAFIPISGTLIPHSSTAVVLRQISQPPASFGLHAMIGLFMGCAHLGLASVRRSARAASVSYSAARNSLIKVLLILILGKTVPLRGEF
jgi:hypothetical protein